MSATPENAGVCEALAERLVEYADGELAPADAAAVERHIAGCAACGRRVAALRRSLAVVEAIWAAEVDSGRADAGRADGSEGDAMLAGAAKLPVRRGARRVLRSPALWLGVAAAAAAVVVAWWPWGGGAGAWVDQGPGELSGEATGEWAAAPAGGTDGGGLVAVLPGRVAAAEPTAEELAEIRAIELQVLRADLAARLLATADWLVEQPEGRERACSEYAYITRAYSDMPAAASAEERLREHCGRREL